MVAIQGLSGVPEPKHERPANLRGRKADETVKGGKVQDDVAISSEAQAAASVARLVLEANSNDDIRLERVEAARERIDKGEHKSPEIVREVAKRISKYLP